jgi:hypothetical protein
MANTYTLISSNVLSSSATSVTFSSIPATYTDLVVRASIRTNAAGSWTGVIGWNIIGATTSSYARTTITGNGSTATSARSTSSYLIPDNAEAESAGNTANTFQSIELYIPNYTSSAIKQLSSFSAGEDNATAGRLIAGAHYVNFTSAISSIVISELGGAQLVSGSSFYLYGIKNS